MSDELVTRLLPSLFQQSEPEFNVFDVMRHGTHEKQLSNVFAWLLDAEGTHGLGDVFQRIFIDQVNGSLHGGEPVPYGDYSVRQEVNTSAVGLAADIADLVLEGDTTVLVVENYYISDPHGHSFASYHDYGAKDGKDSIVVMLCGTVNRDLLTGGWNESAVITWSSLVEPLVRHVDADEPYRLGHPKQCVFFDHMQSHFVKGRRMNREILIPFIEAMCATGEAERYRQNPESAAINFADSLREQGLQQFRESRDLLQIVKASLKTYCSGPLKGQVNEALGEERMTDASANYAGIYQWTINFAVTGEEAGEEAALQIKFGPSAWYANERDAHWLTKVPGDEADYARLFITRGSTKQIYQSAVSIEDVLDGIATDDLRLRDEIVSLLAAPL